MSSQNNTPLSEKKTKISHDNLDRTVFMQQFLKELKTVTEISKAVQSMKTHSHPTVLQKTAMKAI